MFSKSLNWIQSNLYLLCFILAVLAYTIFQDQLDPSNVNEEAIYRPLTIVGAIDKKTAKYLIVIKKNRRCILNIRYTLQKLEGMNFVVFSPKNIVFDDLSLLYRSKILLVSTLGENIDSCSSGKKVHYG